MAQPPVTDKIRRLRQIAERVSPRKPEESLPLIPIEYTGEEEPTRVDQRPDTIPPRSLPARMAKGTADGWKATPRPVQVIAALTALVGALTPIVLAILEALK